MRASRRIINMTLAELFERGPLSAQPLNTISVTGSMTDSLCGAKDANEFHKDCAKPLVVSRLHSHSGLCPGCEAARNLRKES